MNLPECTSPWGHRPARRGIQCRFCGIRIVSFPVRKHAPPRMKMGRKPHTRKRLRDRDGGWFCWWCGKAMEKNQCTIDHVIPRELGGTNGLHNLVLCCQNCNSRKGHTHPLVWIAWLVSENTADMVGMDVDVFDQETRHPLALLCCPDPGNQPYHRGSAGRNL